MNLEERLSKVKRENELLKKKNELLLDLNDLDHSINNLSDLLKNILDKSEDAINAESFIIIKDSSGKYLRLNKQPNSLGLHNIDVGLGVSYFERVNQSGYPQPTVHDKNLYYPLLYSNNLIGVLVLRKDSRFSKLDKTLIGLVSDTVPAKIIQAINLRDREMGAYIDTLTKIYNFGFGEICLDREFNKARELSYPNEKRTSPYRNGLSYLMLDLDHFKRVNDRYGHQAGNLILIEFVNRLLKIIREEDIIFRFGGEEFGIILPETNQYGSVLVGEKLRNAVAEKPFKPEPYTKDTIKMSVSVGGTFFDGTNFDSFRQLIKSADDSLYKAKHNGRNNFVFYEPSTGNYFSYNPRRKMYEIFDDNLNKFAPLVNNPPNLPAPSSSPRQQA